MRTDRINYYITHPRKILTQLGVRGLFNWMPDKQYVKMIFRSEMEYPLNLDNPKTYNEKLQWMKLYDHNPLYCSLVDKYDVKKYVIERIGEDFIIPTLGIWDNVNDIPFEKLPDQYVLKCTHDSGSIIICKGKDSFDIEAAKVKLKKCLKKSFYKSGREWPYKNLHHRIIAEKYMVDSSTDELRDYKFFCFDGKVKAMFIATDRQAKDKPTSFDFFDASFKHLDIRHGHPNAKISPQKPINFELMKHLAEELSKGLPHVRVDFYEVDKEVYFGEMTFFHHGGLVPFDPPKWDLTFGDWLTLPDHSIK